MRVDRRRAGTARRRRSVLTRVATRRRGGGARPAARSTRAPLVFALELFGDLVEHLDAARLEHVVQVAQLVGVGLEIGERGEDLAGRDEAALAHLVEHADHRCVPSAFDRGRVAVAAVQPRRRRARRRSTRGVLTVGGARPVADPFGLSASPPSVIHPTNCSADGLGRIAIARRRARARARRATPSLPTMRSSSRRSIDASNR